MYKILLNILQKSEHPILDDVLLYFDYDNLPLFVLFD